MSLLNKIHINIFTYFIIILSIITGQFRYLLFISIIMFFHGLGHIITSLFFKWNISKIVIFPFGGNIKYDISLNESIFKELLVTISGPLFQLLITLFIQYFSFLSYRDIILFKNISFTLLIFNLLPIVPLDGSKIFFLLFQKITSYNKSHIYLIYVSILVLLIFFINRFNVLTFQTILIFLIYSVIKEYKNHDLVLNRFLLERYLNECRVGRVKVLNGLDPKLIWKEKNNIFIVNKKIYKEKDVLNYYFRK